VNAASDLKTESLARTHPGQDMSRSAQRPDRERDYHHSLAHFSSGITGSRWQTATYRSAQVRKDKSFLLSGCFKKKNI